MQTLKTFSFIFTFFYFLTCLHAQDTWAPVGAKWYFTQGSYMEGIAKTYQTYESVKDTVIDNRNCRMIIETNRFFDSAPKDTYYMYSENDSVFFRGKDYNKFCLLYDFSAEKGDTVVLDCFYTANKPYLNVIIDSVGIVDINGIEKMIQYVSSGDGIYIEFGGKNIKGIGNTFHLFPTRDNYMAAPLRCYFDETTGWFKNPFYSRDDWDMENCDQVVRTSIQEEVIPAFTVYPNPMQDYFTIKPVLSDHKPYDLKIIDIHGRQVLEMVSLIGERKVELRGLPGGMYIIQLIKGDEVGFAKVLKD